MRERTEKLPTLDTSCPLVNSEQQQLMLQFRWEQDFICLQSHQFFHTEGPARNWKGLDKLKTDELAAVFPKAHSNVVLVLKDREISQAVDLQHRLNRDLPPNRFDLLIDTTSQTPFSQWCDQAL